MTLGWNGAAGTGAGAVAVSVAFSRFVVANALSVALAVVVVLALALDSAVAGEEGGPAFSLFVTACSCDRFLCRVLIGSDWIGSKFKPVFCSFRISTTPHHHPQPQPICQHQPILFLGVFSQSNAAKDCLAPSHYREFKSTRQTPQPIAFEKLHTSLDSNKICYYACICSNLQFPVFDAQRLIFWQLVKRLSLTRPTV